MLIPEIGWSFAECILRVIKDNADIPSDLDLEIQSQQQLKEQPDHNPGEEKQAAGDRPCRQQQQQHAQHGNIRILI